MKYYCVFDTNVIIAFFLNKDKESSVYKIINNHFIEKDDIVPITNKKILYEYLNVLKRKKFDKIIDREKAIEFLILFYTKSISIENPSDYISFLDEKTKSELRDEKDFVFYNVVMETKKKINNAYLITGNKKDFPIEIFIKSPKEMIELIECNK